MNYPSVKTLKPQVTFAIRVNSVFRVTSCPEKLAQESRGASGCHAFITCPNCSVVSEGWEMWGENGHRQARASNRSQLIHWIKIKAREQWKTRSGIMGYTFHMGGNIYYRAD